MFLFLRFFFATYSNERDDKEIYMYDIQTQSVNKLTGELSSAFVKVAEANANAQDMENVSIADSGLLEKMPTNPAPTQQITKRVDSFVDDEEADGDDDDSQSQGSVRIEYAVKPNYNDKRYKIDISSGYSHITQ